jgi:hypothetical protein
MRGRASDRGLFLLSVIAVQLVWPVQLHDYIDSPIGGACVTQPGSEKTLRSAILPAMASIYILVCPRELLGLSRLHSSIINHHQPQT